MTNQAAGIRCALLVGLLAASACISTDPGSGASDSGKPVSTSDVGSGTGGSGGGTGGPTPATGGAGGALGGSGGESSPVDALPDAADVAPADVTADAPATDGPTSALRGGTSGRHICPPGDFTSMTPAMTGPITMATGETLANAEGPIWVGAMGTVLFTAKMPGRDDIRRLARLAPSATAPAFFKMNIGNLGMTLDNDDRLITADTQMSAITRLDITTGDVVEVIARSYMGRAFESPNDLIVRGDGNIYFTDPDNANVLGPRPKTGFTAVYRISPAREVSIVETIGPETPQHLNDPNGIALSPDDNTLYAVITHRLQVKRWSLNADGSIRGASTIFASNTGAVPDGMCVDCAGNVYVATQAGVDVFNPAGTKLTTLGPAGAVNCTFGGADHKILYVTAPRVWWAPMNIPGLP